jgi:hypothetical protein
MNELNAVFILTVLIKNYQTGHLPNEVQKLDSLHSGSREVERGR